MALLKFFEGKESSYSSFSHSGGLYFAKDTGVILFKGVKYGSKPGLSNYATKSDISSLQSKLNEKADTGHTHSKSDITNLGLASILQDGLMSATDKSKLDNLYNITDINSGGQASADADSVGVTFSLSRDSGSNFTSTSVISAATTSKAGVMSSYMYNKLFNLSQNNSDVDILLGFDGSSLWNDSRTNVCMGAFGKSLALKLTNSNGTSKYVSLVGDSSSIIISCEDGSMRVMSNIVASCCKYGSDEFANTLGSAITLPVATSSKSGLMSKTDKSKLDTLPTSFKTLNNNSISGSGNILPSQLIGSEYYNILDEIVNENIGVNAVISGNKLTIGLYNFDTSTWIGASRVTVTLP